MVSAKEVGRRVRERRVARRFRREEVAVKAGISMSTMDNLEQGRRLPRIETLDKIAEVLETSVAELVARRQLQVA